MEGRGWRGEDGGEKRVGEKEEGEEDLGEGRGRREGTVGGVVCLPAVACLLFSNSS